MIVALIITITVAYAMAAYMAEKRAKELCIGKVKGATVKEVIQMSLKEIFIMLLISFLIASPIAYFVSLIWLENLTEKISIGTVPFILTIVVLPGFVSLSVYLKEIQAALINPAENPRQV